MDRKALIHKEFLKIRADRDQLLWRRCFLEIRIGSCDRDHLFEIVRVIGAHVEDASGGEDVAGQFHEAGIDQPSAVVLAFGPGIGEIDVNRLGASLGQEIFQGVGRFKPKKPDIFQAQTRAFPVEFADAPEQAFDRQEIALRMQRRVAKEERSIPAAQFDFQWLDRRKQGVCLNGFDNAGGSKKKRRFLDRAIARRIFKDCGVHDYFLTKRAREAV